MSGSVNVLNPSGDLVSLPADQVNEALSAGYKVARPPDIQAYRDKQEHGEGFGNELASFAEGAASGLTFGVSRHMENSLGITTPEAQGMRKEYNPNASMAGEVTGIAAPMLASLGAAAPVEGAAEAVNAASLAKGALRASPVNAVSAAGHAVTSAAMPLAKKGASLLVNPETSPLLHSVLAKSGANAIGSSVEAAAYGLGQSVDESALGDPDAMGEKLMHNIGFSALLGGTIGGILGPFSRTASKESGAIQSALQDDIASTAAISNHAAEGAAPLADVAQTPFKDMPGSLADIKGAVKGAGPMVPEGLPQRAALKDAIDNLPDLQFKPHALQYESLEDQALRDYYKTFLESSADDAKDLRQYEALQKQEGVVKTDHEINSLSPTKKASADPVEGGNKAIKAFTDQYEAEKKELAPAFKQFDEIAKGTRADAGNVVLKLQDANVGLDAEKLINIADDGKFSVEKYSPDMSISKKTHSALKDVMQVLNKEDVTISQLRNVRESIRDIGFGEMGPRDQAQIGAIRRVLMDEMQERIERGTTDQGLRETFKRFAQNEEKRSVIEKIFGGSVSDSASFAKKIVPEDVLNRIFSDTVSVKAAKDILGSKFDQVAADFLAHKKASFTDPAKNGFSSQKFSTFLKGKTPELAEAFAEKPQTLKRLNALSDYMRILPDSPSVNPSGTAKTLGILERISSLPKLLNPRQMLIDFGEKKAQALELEKQRSTIDKILQGQKLSDAKQSIEDRTSHIQLLDKMERMAQKTSTAIQDGVTSIFSGAAKGAKASSGYLGSHLGSAKGKRSAQNDKSDVVAQINSLQNNPQGFIDHLDQLARPIHGSAPNSAMSLQSTMTRAVTFLHSKVPQPPAPMPLSKPLPVSANEMAVFEKYYHAVENPIATLHKIKNCEIGPEAVEAISNVYPKLYEEMTSKVMEAITDKSAKIGSIPYATKLGLSMFLQQDLDHTTNQQAIASNQMSLASHAQGMASQGAPNALHKNAKLTGNTAMLTPAQSSAQRPVT